MNASTNQYGSIQPKPPEESMNQSALIFLPVFMGFQEITISLKMKLGTN